MAATHISILPYGAGFTLYIVTYHLTVLFRYTTSFGSSIQHLNILRTQSKSSECAYWDIFLIPLVGNTHTSTKFFFWVYYIITELNSFTQSGEQRHWQR